MLSPIARSDLEEIADWIAQESASRTVRVLREIRDELRRISEHPFAYQLRPEIGEDARLAVVGRYVVLFRIADDIVRIERVAYGGRDLPTLYQ